MNKQIAAQLGVTEETVKWRVKSILSKLGANDRTEAAVSGLKGGIMVGPAQACCSCGWLPKCALPADPMCGRARGLAGRLGNAANSKG